MVEIHPNLKILQSLIRNELTKPPKPEDPITNCDTARLSEMREKPEEALIHAHKQLHVFPFKDVPDCWRRMYTDASLWKILGLKGGSDWPTQVVEILDMALIMTGAPLRQDLIETVFQNLEKILEDQARWDDDLDTSTTNDSESSHTGPISSSKSDGVERSGKINMAKSPAHTTRSPKHSLPSLSRSPSPVSKRRKRQDAATHDTDKQHPTVSSSSIIPDAFPAPRIPNPPLLHLIPRIYNPSLPDFQMRLNTDHKTNNSLGPLPMILTGAMTHWPALDCSSGRSWASPRYLLKKTLGGRRLVPVEIGQSYTDDSWGQQIMPFKEFLKRYMLETPFSTDEATEEDNDEEDEDKEGKEEETPQTGYLAQHDLFAQIPSLRNDIAIPDYCYSNPPPANPTTSPAAEAEQEVPTPILLNAWFGPTNTISPLHTDPHHNILAQVTGKKYIRLYSPTQTPLLYPRSQTENGDVVDMSNTSSVDVGSAMRLLEDRREYDDICDLEGERGEFESRFPRFQEAVFVEAVLGAGECLFVPKGWWHYVRSLSPSFSVSFWWD